MRKLLPIHVIYPKDIEKVVISEMRTLATDISYKNFPFTVQYRFICLGEVTNTMLDFHALQLKNYRFSVDFGGALIQTLNDYEVYKDAGWELLQPEIISFFINQPTSWQGWNNEWTKILDTYKTNMFIRVIVDNASYTTGQMRQIPKKIDDWFPNKSPNVKSSLISPDSKNPVEILIHKAIFDPGGYKYLLEQKANTIRPVLPQAGTIHPSPSQTMPVQNVGIVQKIGGQRASVPSGFDPSPSLQKTNSAPEKDKTIANPIPGMSNSQQVEPKTVDVDKVEPVKEEPKPIPLKPVQPAEWQVKDPPAELGDRTSHLYSESRDAGGKWYISGASRRGKLHENEATFREDAFAIDYAAYWILVAVADGAGSHYLSRVGSNLAVKTALETMRKEVENRQPDELTVKKALEQALRESWKALYQEAERRKVEFRDLSTTLLLLMYHPRKNYVGIAQIGDGLLAGQFEDGQIFLLGHPESGEYSGQTYFLTNHKPEDFPSKCEFLDADKRQIRYFFVMTDGVADDLYPPKDKLPGLIKPIPSVMAAEVPDKALLELINYPRPGSFDDRTLVVVCKREEVAVPAPKEEKAVSPAPEKTRESVESRPESSVKSGEAISEEKQAPVASDDLQAPVSGEAAAIKEEHQSVEPSGLQGAQLAVDENQQNLENKKTANDEPLQDNQ